MNCARKHTLVTGCSSGIGRSTALRLARDGQHVYAGIRKPADGDRLTQSAAGGEITPVILDVTEPGHIAAPRPRAVYLCGKDSRRLAVLSGLPAPVLDLARRRIFRLPAPGSLAS
jgi:NAD(P)-dependent dehydrogenase (short-subunit alcohol dehydrogenase family)